MAFKQPAQSVVEDVDQAGRPYILLARVNFFNRQGIPLAAHSRRQRPKAKARCKPRPRSNTVSKTKGEIEFPDFRHLHVANPSPWSWARGFVEQLRGHFKVVPDFGKVEVLTEFTGTTCAEAAAESVAAALGVHVDFVSAADINPQCRKVILATCQGLRW